MRNEKQRTATTKEIIFFQFRKANRDIYIFFIIRERRVARSTNKGANMIDQTTQRCKQPVSRRAVRKTNEHTKKGTEANKQKEQREHRFFFLFREAQRKQQTKKTEGIL
jgi:hypothetical protein